MDQLKVIKKFVNIFHYKTRLSKDLIEDFVMEAFTRMYEKQPENNNLEGWLRITITNIIHDHFREDKKLLYYYDNEESIIDVDLIRGCINELEDKQRQIVILHYYEGFKYHEIAEILNIQMHDVKNRIKRAKYLLKIQLIDIHGD